MFSFLRKKATASDVALGVLMFVKGSEQSAAGWLKCLSELDVRLDERRVLDELVCLRIFAGHYAISEALGRKPERQRVVDTYDAQFDRETKQYPEDFGARELIKTRVVAYAKAAATAHHIGPPWTVGCLFAELCGAKEDIRIVTMGGTEFKLVVKFVSEYVKSFRVV